MALLGAEQKDLKRCPDCDSYKGAYAFYRNKKAADGLTVYCKVCMDRRRKENAAKKPPPRKYNKVKGDVRQVTRILDAYRKTGGNHSAISRITGIDRGTIRGVLEDNKERIAQELPPDPIPYDELTEDAKKGLEDFRFFSHRYLGLEFEPWTEELAASLLEAYESPDDEYLVVNVAYGAGKSTVVTYAFPVWVICRQRAMMKEPTIFLGHRAEERAKWYLGRIRQTFTQNRDLISAYGRFKPDNKGATAWATNEIVVEPVDWQVLKEKEPTIAIGSQTGAVMGGHYGLVLWDDLVDDKNSTTAGQRSTLREFFTGTAESRLRTGGTLALIGARFGPEDLSHDRLSEVYDDELDEHGQPKKTYRRIVYKAHYEELCTTEHPRDLKPWPESCLLSPRFVPWQRIKKAKLDERKFLLRYQQEDVDPEGSLADPMWFEGGEDKKGLFVPGCFDRERSFGQAKPEAPELSAIVVDPSASKWWAVLHFLVYADGTQLVFRGKRAAMQAPDLIYREASGEFTGLLEDWYQATKSTANVPRFLIVEQNAQQKWLTQYEFVRTWAQNRGIVLLPHQTNRIGKADPDRGVEMNRNLYRDGRIRLPYMGIEEKFLADAFKREATSWPEGDSSDLVMAHWFLTYNLQNLLAASQLDDHRPSDSPEWAHEGPPEWASDILTPA